MQQHYVVAHAVWGGHTFLGAGGHMFEKGAFSVASRATNLAYKVGSFGLRSFISISP